MPSTSTQSQSSKPSPLSQYLAETLSGYVLGPNFQNAPAKYYPTGAPSTTTTSKPPTTQPTGTPPAFGPTSFAPAASSIPSMTTNVTGPASSPGYPFATAGQLPGSILPNYNDLLNQTSYFDMLASPNPNPILSSILGSVMSPPPTITVGGGGGGAGMGGAAGLGQLIGSGDVNKALQGLENPASVFDTMSGGPIVNEIAKRTDAQTEAIKKKGQDTLAQNLDIATANLGGQGLISSSQVLAERGKVTNQVMDDFNTFLTTGALENTKYLGDLAMRDALMKSDNLKAVLQQAMIEKGINADYAASMAKVASDEAIAQAQIQANLYTNQQNQYTNLLNLGAQDYATTQATENKMRLLPIDMLTSAMTGLPGLSSGSSSSKAL